jgi:hypothetical protein
VFAIAMSGLFRYEPAEAAARPRAGQACTNRQIGVVIGTPGIVCSYLTPCRGRSKFVWVPMSSDGAFPSPSMLIRYGQCRTPVTTTTLPDVAFGAGSGAACLVGTWSFSSTDMQRFLFEASGSYEAGRDLTGTITYKFNGSATGGQISRGAVTASGTLVGNSPEGGIKVVVAPAIGAQFDASDNTIQFRNAVGLFDIQISFNGVIQPAYEVTRIGREVSLQTYECSGSTIRFVVDIPPAAGQPARKAAVVLHRV